MSLKELRKRTGLTQEELAEKIGMSQGNFSRIERGEQGVGVETLMEMASALDCSVEEVLKAITEDRPRASAA